MNPKGTLKNWKHALIGRVILPAGLVLGGFLGAGTAYDMHMQKQVQARIAEAPLEVLIAQHLPSDEIQEIVQYGWRRYEGDKQQFGVADVWMSPDRAFQLPAHDCDKAASVAAGLGGYDLLLLIDQESSVHHIVALSQDPTTGLYGSVGQNRADRNAERYATPGDVAKRFPGFTHYLVIAPSEYLGPNWINSGRTDLKDVMLSDILVAGREDLFDLTKCEKIDRSFYDIVYQNIRGFFVKYTDINRFTKYSLEELAQKAGNKLVYIAELPLKGARWVWDTASDFFVQRHMAVALLNSMVVYALASARGLSQRKRVAYAFLAGWIPSLLNELHDIAYFISVPQPRFPDKSIIQFLFSHDFPGDIDTMHREGNLILHLYRPLTLTSSRIIHASKFALDTAWDLIAEYYTILGSLKLVERLRGRIQKQQREGNCMNPHEETEGLEKVQTPNSLERMLGSTARNYTNAVKKTIDRIAGTGDIFGVSPRRLIGYAALLTGLVTLAWLAQDVWNQEIIDILDVGRAAVTGNIRVTEVVQTIGNGIPLVERYVDQQYDALQGAYGVLRRLFVSARYLQPDGEYRVGLGYLTEAILRSGAYAAVAGVLMVGMAGLYNRCHVPPQFNERVGDHLGHVIEAMDRKGHEILERYADRVL
ncbi:hypothetical protein COY95_00230 [Candidatus Woesearchaeota archaeon CG_4_10_14_0_8_um_filter_47_5]|nr:MAG: hypothetical protein COY95_00230 [Candidatus Woesearchaeota archaeon CG_4_10_14_0_8_um_filter_47_5]